MDARHALVVFALFAFAAGCSEETNEALSTVAPGTSTLAFAGITYSSAEAFTEDGAITRLCHFTPPGNTLALIQGSSTPPLSIPLGNDCSGPYSGSAWKGPVSVVAVVVGEELPEVLTIVALDGFSRQALWHIESETWLVSLREVRGEWFITHDHSVELTSSPVDGPPPDFASDMPTTFEDLVSRSEANLADFEGRCPDQVEVPGSWSEARWEELVFTPGASRQCPNRPRGEPDAGTP